MKLSDRTFVWWIVLLFLSVTACGGSNREPAALPDVTLEVSSAPATSPLEVFGLDIDACPLSNSEIRVGGETAPAVLNRKRELLIRLPLFYDEATQWSAPPSGPQDVEIFCNGSLLTTLHAAITVTELPRAPGTTEAIVVNYTQILAYYERLAESLAPDPGIQQQVFRATFGALKELVSGTSEDSLPVLLDELRQSEPEELALLDAMHAVGRVDEDTAAFRDLMEQMSTLAVASEAAVPAGTVPKALLPDIKEAIPTSDVALAKGMQSYAILSSFSEDFLHNTAEDFAKVTGLLAAFSGKFRLAEIIDAVLYVLDYVMNKLVVSAFPATLDEIKLEMPVTKLQNSEVTASRFTLYASNVPASMSISDLTSGALNVLGVLDLTGSVAAGEAAAAWIKPFEEILQGLAKFTLDRIGDGLKTYAELHPEGFDYDLALFDIVPQMRFEAVGETRELYVLEPTGSEVIRPLDDRLEWRASDTVWGSAEVYVTGGPGPASLFWGSLYNGAVFGESNTRSNGVSVTVGDPSLVLEKHHVTVLEGGSESVGVKLSNEPAGAEDTVSVSVRKLAGDEDIYVRSAPTISFKPSNWNTYQYVEIAAAEDEDDEDGHATISLEGAIDAGGEEPIRLEGAIVATELDNDRLTFVIDPTAVRVPEGETAVFNVKLNQPPPSAFRSFIAYASGDSDILVQSPTTLLFDEDNWDTLRTVTLYAREDDDSVEGSARIRIAANEPNILGERSVTATEDEPGEALTIQFATWNDGQSVTVEGTLQIELDPDNYDSPLQWRGGVLYARAVTGAFTWKGRAYLAITNFDPSRPACTCPPHECYERENPEDTILQAEGQILWEPDPWPVLAYHVTILFPLLDGTTFETTCEVGSYGRFYSVELTL
ncbi:MAG: hypothetical protein WBM74_11110 [Polyangiales bacterium]